MEGRKGRAGVVRPTPQLVTAVLSAGGFPDERRTTTPGSIECCRILQDMITVPEAAKRTGKHPETVRRWIREGKLRSSKVGTQHLIDEAALVDLGEAAVVPRKRLERTTTGENMPNFVAALRRSRRAR